MCLIIPTAPLSTGRNWLVFRCLQSFYLSTYFAAGLWKVRNLDLSSFSAAALHPIASNVSFGNMPDGVVLDFIRENLWAVTGGFAFMFLFELSCIIPVIFLRHFKLWGLAIFSFHMVSGLTAGIWWKETAIAALLLLVLCELLMEQEKKDPSCR